MSIAEKIRALQPGEQMMCIRDSAQAVYAASRRAGFKVVIRRVCGEIIVWRMPEQQEQSK